MRVRSLGLACAGLLALAAPSRAQIIATSIPREDVGGGMTSAASDHDFSVHIMASPFAKWKINSYVEEPKGDEFPVFQQAATTDSASKFILAGEVAFAAGENITIGIGGWYNTLGETDVEVFELDLDGGTVFGGAATQDFSVSELHANVFYKNVGLQVGLVRTSAQLTGFRAGSVFGDLNTGEFGEFERDVTLEEFGEEAEEFNSTNWDAFLVYKRGLAGRYPAGISVGAGLYRDSQASSTHFSGFVTASVQVFRGLGIDASYWYVGGSKPTAAREELAELLEGAVSDSLSRFTIGIGYTFPN